MGSEGRHDSPVQLPPFMPASSPWKCSRGIGGSWEVRTYLFNQFCSNPLQSWNGILPTHPHIVSCIIYLSPWRHLNPNRWALNRTPSPSSLSVDSCHGSADSALSGHTPLCILITRGRCCCQERCLCLQTPLPLLRYMSTYSMYIAGNLHPPLTRNRERFTLTRTHTLTHILIHTRCHSASPAARGPARGDVSL